MGREGGVNTTVTVDLTTEGSRETKIPTDPDRRGFVVSVRPLLGPRTPFRTRKPGPSGQQTFPVSYRRWGIPTGFIMFTLYLLITKRPFCFRKRESFEFCVSFYSFSFIFSVQSVTCKIHHGRSAHTDTHTHVRISRNFITQ